MATEAIEARDIDTSTVVGKLNEYCEIYVEQLYKKHFGISNMQVLIITTLHLRLLGILNRVEALAEKGELAGTRPFLFASAPEVEKEENRPLATGRYFTTAYKLLRFPDAYINILDNK